MISSEVQRTLVKSPPELWSELSDPTALTKHLGELGEVHITRLEPERTVEWEAEAATGKVELAASGWGTKVTLSLQREPEAAAEPEVEEPTAEPEPEPEAEPEPEPAAEAEPEPEPEPAAEAHAEPEQLSQPKRGFFARLFRRKAKPAAVPAEPPTAMPDPAAAPAPMETEAVADAEVESEDENAAEGESTDLAAELKVAEEALEADSVALLNGVLDRLGAAHHRPFSRA